MHTSLIDRRWLGWVVALVLVVSVVVGTRTDDANAQGAGGIDAVFISTGVNFPDALGAGPAAALGIGPILLVAQDQVPDATIAELNRLAPQTIYIVGGTAVVSPAVESILENLAFSPDVVRLAGGNRYETAAAVSAEVFPHLGFLGATDKAADSNLLDGLDSTDFLGVNDKAADADLLDGKDSSVFLEVTGKAADSDLLDGMDSSAFLGAGDKAADSDLLDGLDSSAFLQPSGLVAAHVGGPQTATVTATDTTVRSLSLTAPSAGVVVVNSTATAGETTGGDRALCSITTGTALEHGFHQVWESAGIDGTFGQLAGTRGFDVAAGEFTVNLVCSHVGSSVDTTILQSALTAIFIPGS